MTLVNLETGEVVDRPTYGEVKGSIATAKASLEAAAEQIVWQIEVRAWEVLGHTDWNAMREAEYGGAAFMVPRAERPELVARMRRSGLTTTEIAETAGVSDETVRRDLHSTNGGPPVRRGRAPAQPHRRLQRGDVVSRATFACIALLSFGVVCNSVVLIVLALRVPS